MNIFLSDNHNKFKEYEGLFFGVYTKSLSSIDSKRNYLLDLSSEHSLSILDSISSIDYNNLYLMLDYSSENLKLVNVIRKDLNIKFGFKIKDRFVIKSVMCFENSADFVMLHGMSKETLCTIHNIRNSSMYDTKLFALDALDHFLEHVEAVCYLDKDVF